MNTQPIIVGDGRSERRDARGDREQEATGNPSEDNQREDSTAETAVETRDTSAHDEREAPYLPEQTSGPAGDRWQNIQAQFVDDPRKAVTQAHELVGELTQRIVDAFAKERSDLEQQWSKGEDVSTEDLRVCLQRYRAFFSRLLPSVDKLQQPD